MSGLPISISKGTNNNVIISVPTNANKMHRLESTEMLAGNNTQWQKLDEFMGTGDIKQVEVSTAQQSQLFFRAIEETPPVSALNTYFEENGILMENGLKVRVLELENQIGDTIMGLGLTTVNQIQELLDLWELPLSPDQINALEIYSVTLADRYFINDVEVDQTFILNLLAFNGRNINPLQNVMNQIIRPQAYDNLLSKYGVEQVEKGTTRLLIKDPAQGDQIVSEGQSYWQLLSAYSAFSFPERADLYQEKFDQLLAGTEKMMDVAVVEGQSPGVFPAWKVFQDGNVLTLEPNIMGHENSASDADLDLIYSLILAHQLTQQTNEAGEPLWEDHGYLSKAYYLISSASRNLFDTINVNGHQRFIQKPSEDWSDFYMVDYFAPALYKEIVIFLEETGGSATQIAFWNQATQDALTWYQSIYEQFGEFPSHVNKPTVSGDQLVWTERENHDNYARVRVAMKLGQVLRLMDETPEQFAFMNDFFESDASKNITGNKALDDAMNLSLAMGLGLRNASLSLANSVRTRATAEDYYYNGTLPIYGTAVGTRATEVRLNLDEVAVTPPQASVSKWFVY